MGQVLNKNKRVLIAMSGGVDSSVAAYLLKKQGYDVIGIFLKLWNPPCYDSCGSKKQNLCCDDKAMDNARQVAGKLKIPFYVLKVDKLFKKEIVDNFVSEYEQGKTPNPCVRCNKYVKFGYLWEKARQLKTDYLATGHYVRKSQISNLKSQNFGVASRRLKLPITNYQLQRSKDPIKDQTYFLSSIDSKIIPHLLFPLGGLTKKEVREIAKKAKISVYNKKDSQGICFIPDGDMDMFLKHFSSPLQRRGNIVDKKGNILGRHQGLLGYTIGQREGINSEIANKYFKFKILNLKFKIKGKDIPRLYVIAIDSRKNRLVIGENEDCFSDTMTIENVNILDKRFWELFKKKKVFLAQIRGGHKPEKALLFLENPKSQIPNPKQITNPKSQKINKLIVKFAKPVRAITPGQTVALYEKNILIAGGIIK